MMQCYNQEEHISHVVSHRLQVELLLFFGGKEGGGVPKFLLSRGEFTCKDIYTTNSRECPCQAC